ncbi:hypothetical protein GALMADRAFT_78954, partial [Galerina marginata CBS 339.88]
ELLMEASAPAAFHNSEQRFDPPKCHPNTRVAVLNRITDWVLGTDADFEQRQAFIMWLYGAAGAGKSAVAQTIAEKCDEDGVLLASFFFSRTDPTRNHTGKLVATIAYQVSLKSPEAKALIVDAVEHDPLIFSKSLETQFSRLIFEPLQSASSSHGPNPQSTYLIVIDGLDECIDMATRCAFLRIILASPQLQSPTTLRFLVGSRPELDIRTLIDSQALETRPYRLGLDDGYGSNADIHLYLVEKFNELTLNHPHRAYIPDEWPTDDIINKLVRNSSGQFIYASTVVKYVSSEDHKPTNQLDIILGLRSPRSQAPFGALDELYTHIFSTVGDIDLVLHVFGFVIIGMPGWPIVWQIEEILGLELGDLQVLFSRLHSVVSFYYGPWETSASGSLQFAVCVKSLHASLEDFLLDESRSRELYINPGVKHALYAQICFKHLHEGRLI